MGDVIAHGGASLGNLVTAANFGVEMRFGSWVPDNFGSAPLLPVAENAAPSLTRVRSNQPLVHAFLAMDVRYVAFDITLDGNTWRDSASVDRRDVAANLGVGIAAHWRGWKIAVAHYVQTKEFDNQQRDARLGSLTIRRDIVR
jgi:hypothetical protein